MTAASDNLTLRLLREVLSCPSVTPEDKGCQNLISGFLIDAGFESETICRGKTDNLYCWYGSAGPLFLFAGHTDVVPPGCGWNTDPFAPTEVDGNLVARGAQDMKTSDVCFAAAAKQFVKNFPNFKGRIALLLTSDEEGDGKDGTAFAIEELKKKGIQPDFCIVGEPTCSKELGDTIKNGRRGSCNCRVTIYGEQGHVAYPLKVENPIHTASKIISKLAQTQWDQGCEGFPSTSFQVSNITAGTGAVNIVPGSCSFVFNLRYNPATSGQEIENKANGIIKEFAENSDISWEHSAFPFNTEGKELTGCLEKAISKVQDIKPALSTTGGTSDARFISRWCSEVVEFGPVNNLIHKANESIPLKDIPKLTEIYYQTLVNLFSVSSK